MRIPGPTLVDLDRRRDAFATRVVDQVRRVLEEAAGRLDGRSDVEDLNVVRTLWAKRVGELLDGVGDAYAHGVAVVHGNVVRAVDALVAAAEDVVPVVSNARAEVYLSNASNRLVNLGDDVWDRARTELLDGTRAGESVAQLRDRVVGATDLAAPRAEVIARTEVNAAANAGSVEEMRALGLRATKTWLASGGARTRASHAEADGQTVALDEPFEVGGLSLDFPGDPGGDPGETINCRCTTTFEVADDELDRLVDGSELGGYVSGDELTLTDVEWQTLDDERRLWLRSAGFGDTTDPALLPLLDRQGFTGLPGSISADALPDDWVRLYRGLSGPDAAAADRYVREWTSGRYFPGTGAYGSGTYTTIVRGYAQGYADTQAHGRLMTMALRSSARVVDFRDLEDMMDDALPRMSPTKRAYLDDPGRFAAWRGYDAIRKTRGGGAESFYVVLNRTATVMVK